MNNTIVISKEQYEHIRRCAFREKPILANWDPITPFILNMVTGVLKRPATDRDVNQYLKQYGGSLGEIHKKYNPYEWSIEVIFETEKDANMFCLKELS